MVYWETVTRGGTRSIAALHEYDRARLILIEDLGDSPEYVYLLIDPDANRPELSTTGKTNEVALWAYTTVLLLTESCGDGQPYTTVTPAQLRNFANELDTTALLAIDIRHPAGVRYPGTPWTEIEPITPMAPENPDEPVVWIPTRPARKGDRQVVAELHGTKPGENLLLVFGTPEEAWEACGPYQSLTAVRLDRLQTVASECGANAIVANGWLDESARHQTPVQDWTRKKR